MTRMAKPAGHSSADSGSFGSRVRAPLGGPHSYLPRESDSSRVCDSIHCPGRSPGDKEYSLSNTCQIVRMNFPTSDNWFLKATRTIGRGFLLGLGFGAALGCVHYVAYQATVKNVNDDVRLSDSDSHAVNEIVLSDVGEQRHDGITAIIGKASNSGQKAARGIHIQANFFDH